MRSCAWKRLWGNPRLGNPQLFYKQREEFLVSFIPPTRALLTPDDSDVSGAIFKSLCIRFLTCSHQKMLREFLLNFPLSGHPKSVELTAGWRKWHDQELYNLYSSTNVTYFYDEIKNSHMCWTFRMQPLSKQCTQDFDSKTSEG
jgi:hypothetical protein